MDPITQAAAGGLTGLTQYGIAGILLLLLLVGGVFMIRYFMDQFKACHENSIQMFKEDSAINRQVNEKNTEAFHGVQIALAKLEAKLDK